MRTETLTRNIYTFDELSEESQKKAVYGWLDASSYDEWWEFIYEDAAEIGLKITGFDLGGRQDIDGNFTFSPCEVAQNILNNHGEGCETYKTAESFLKEWNPVYADYLDENSEKYETREAEEEMMEMEKEFLHSLLQDYFITLRKEYEWYFSEENAKENILCNEYEYLEDGKMA
jgi:hypothetical protein